MAYLFLKFREANFPWNLIARSSLARAASRRVLNLFEYILFPPISRCALNLCTLLSKDIPLYLYLEEVPLRFLTFSPVVQARKFFRVLSNLFPLTWSDTIPSPGTRPNICRCISTCFLSGLGEFLTAYPRLSWNQMYLASSERSFLSTRQYLFFLDSFILEGLFMTGSIKKVEPLSQGGF